MIMSSIELLQYNFDIDFDLSAHTQAHFVQ